MARRRRLNHAAWTLIYFRGPKGKQEPVGQLHLNEHSDPVRLLQVDLPDLLKNMSKRSKRWAVMFLDESEHDGMLELWDRPQMATLHMQAACAWLAVCADSGLDADVALRLLHHRTIEDLASCIRGGLVRLDPQRLPTHTLSQHLETFARNHPIVPAPNA